MTKETRRWLIRWINHQLFNFLLNNYCGSNKQKDETTDCNVEGVAYNDKNHWTLQFPSALWSVLASFSSLFSVLQPFWFNCLWFSLTAFISIVSRRIRQQFFSDKALINQLHTTCPAFNSSQSWKVAAEHDGTFRCLKRTTFHSGDCLEQNRTNSEKWWPGTPWEMNAYVAPCLLDV